MAEPEKFSPEEIRKKIQEAGVVGMGGAGFPTHVQAFSQGTGED